MTLRRMLGRAFLIGLCLILLVCSIRSLLGYIYHWTSPEDVFVCHDVFCLRPGVAHSYEITGRRNGKSVALYSCSFHPLPRYTQLNALDRPTPLSFLMASSLVWGPALWVFAKSRREQQSIRKAGLAVAVPGASTEGTKPTFIASLDTAADSAADSLSHILRRFFVNGLCLAGVGLPILAIADMSLPKLANATLSILAVCLSAGLWRIATVIEKEYTENDELRDEFSALTFRLFIKRFVNWGAIIYGLVGVGYLIALIF